MIMISLSMIVIMRVRMVMGRIGTPVSSRDGLGRGEHEPPGLDSLGADQVISEVADLPGGAAQENHFQAALFVEMHVRRGNDPVKMMVLQVGQPAPDPRDVMIVDQGDDPHRLAVAVRDRFFDQCRAHQAADSLAPVGMTMKLAILVESAKQFSPDRDAEPDQRVFHGGLSQLGTSD
jgi:hypothetical protein